MPRPAGPHQPEARRRRAPFSVAKGLDVGGRRRGPGLWGAVSGAALLLAALWVAGLFWFAAKIPGDVADPLTETDAIVVLTGGQGRLKAGLALLTQGRGRKLFVSGVHQSVDVAALLRPLGEAPERFICCIDLGHGATDTAGNALETAAWMARQGFRSLRLVTANYHMPRSLAEFRHSMPGVALIANPVFTREFEADEWWRRPATAALVTGEFAKYLVTLTRPGGGRAQ